MAMVLSAVIPGIGCQDKQATPQPKPVPATKVDAGGKKVDAGNNPARDAGAPDVPAGTPDAATTSTGAGGTMAPGTPPATDTGGTGGTTGARRRGGGPTRRRRRWWGRSPRPRRARAGRRAPPPTRSWGGPTRLRYHAAATATLRIAAIGDSAPTEKEARVADLVSGWTPDFVMTSATTTTRRAARRPSTQNIGKYYARSSATTAALRPGSATTASGRRPAITTGAPGADAVPRLLHAARQRALLRRRSRPRPPVRDGQRRPRTRRQHRRSTQARWLKDSAGVLDVLLRPRLLPPPAILLRRATAAIRTCAGRSRLGRGGGLRRSRPQLRARQGRRHSVLRRRHRGRGLAAVREAGAAGRPSSATRTPTARC